MDFEISNKTHELLKRYDITLKKSLGQNFLTDANILEKIVKEAGINENTGVIEIGPGIGSLTQKIAEKAGRVVSVEIDKRLVPILTDIFSDKDNVEIIQQDILKIPLKNLIDEKLSKYKTIKVVANLPYYITSSIIMKLLEEKLSLDSITVMVQKEVAERISANPGGKDYGSLTLLVKYYAEAEILFTVPSTVFIPRPNVESAILHLKIRERPIASVEDEEFLFKVIKSSFAQRRKTIVNNLLHNLLGKDKKNELETILLDLKIDPKRRAETLTLDDFVNISNKLIFFEH